MLNSLCLLTLDDDIYAINKHKRDKAPGPDGIHTEAFTFGCHRFFFYLSILFNLCLMYGCVPDALHHATIIPLVRGGDQCLLGDSITEVK